MPQLRAGRGRDRRGRSVAEPRLRRRVREVLRGLRAAAGGRDHPGRRALPDAVPDADRVDGRRRSCPRTCPRSPPSYEGALFADLETLLSARAARPRSPCSGTSPSRSGVLEGAYGVDDADGPDRAWPRPRRRASARGHPGRTAPLLRRLRPPALQAARVAADAGRPRQRRRRRAGRPLNWVVVHRAPGPRRRGVLRAARRPAGRAGDRAVLRARPVSPRRPARGTTAAQIEHIDAALGRREWGICTECGMGRAKAEDVPELLDLHREILAAREAAPA